MNITQCEQALQTQYDTNSAQLDNISKLTNVAWGKDKASCFSQMGQTDHIKDFLTNKPAYEAYKKTIPVQIVTTQTTQPTNWLQQERATVMGHSDTILMYTGIVIAMVVGFFVIRKGLRLLYDMLNASRMIYLKINIPRNESKEDREQEKELAKDMKEKI